MGNIKYDIYQNPDLGVKKKGFHVRVAKSATVSFHEVKKRLSNSASVTPSDISAVTEGLSDLLSATLSSGGRLHIKGLGYFSLSIHTPSFEDPSKVNATKLRIKGVDFRPDSELMKQLREGVRFERSQVGGHSLNQTDADIRRSLHEYFKENDSISVRDVQFLCNLTRPTAYRRIRELCTGPVPLLKHIGPKNASVYVLAQNADEE